MFFFGTLHIPTYCLKSKKNQLGSSLAAIGKARIIAFTKTPKIQDIIKPLNDTVAFYATIITNNLSLEDMRP